MSNTDSPPPWADIDTLLLDMDGTLIDLHFDNALWNDCLTIEYATRHQLDHTVAQRQLLEHMQAHEGSIDYYCVDLWEEFTGLDIMALHEANAERLRYREGTEVFLNWVHLQPLKVILTTNAHRKSVNFKNARLELLPYFDRVVSSHDYRYAKEQPEFWHSMQKAEGFDPKRTMFIDDHEGVLITAHHYGIEHLYCVSTPDSQRAGRTSSRFPLLNNLSSLIQ